MWRDHVSCDHRGDPDDRIRRTERDRIASYIERAAARKRENAEAWFSADAIVANAWDEVAGWCRDETIWNGDD